MHGLEKAGLSSAELGLDMESGGGALADYNPLHHGGLWGGTRAGRATQVARSLGEEPGFNLKYPQTSASLGSLAGGLGGAALGGVAGVGIGHLVDPTDHSGVGGLVGAGIGGLTGGLGVPLIQAILRRARIKELAAKVDSGASLDASKTPSFGLGAYLTPFGGAHRAGQADVVEALRSNKPVPSSTGRNVGYAAQAISGGYGMPLWVGQGIQQTANANRRIKANPDGRKPEEESEPEPKDGERKKAAMDAKFLRRTLSVEKRAVDPGRVAGLPSGALPSQPAVRDRLSAELSPEQRSNRLKLPEESARSFGLSRLGTVTDVVGGLSGGVTGGIVNSLRPPGAGPAAGALQSTLMQKILQAKQRAKAPPAPVPGGGGRLGPAGAMMPVPKNAADRVAHRIKTAAFRKQREQAVAVVGACLTKLAAQHPHKAETFDAIHGFLVAGRSLHQAVKSAAPALKPAAVERLVWSLTDKAAELRKQAMSACGEKSFHGKPADGVSWMLRN